MAKMSLTRRQVATIVSVLYLAALTAIATYAVRQSHHYSIPISSTLTSFALALPLFAGLSLETSTALARALSSSQRFRHRHASNIPAVLLPSSLTLLTLLVYTTVIATLAGTHISPMGGLACVLRERWQDLFRSKAGQQLRQIQDGLQCCGFQSVRDMPFPFPSASHGVGVDRCVELYPERATTACKIGWMGIERTAASCLLAVAIGTFCWMAAIVAIPAIHPTWARESLRLPGSGFIEAGPDDADPEQQSHLITGAEIPYRDDPGETEQDRQDRLREIAALNNDSRLALQVESSRESRPSKLMREVGDNTWADGESR